jgi:hypothetical protein
MAVEQGGAPVGVTGQQGREIVQEEMGSFWNIGDLLPALGALVGPYGALAGGVLGTYLNYSRGSAADAERAQQVAAANQAAMANYRLALADRAMLAQQRALQAKFQEEASAVELVRQSYEEAGIRISQGFRMQDRRREGLEAQVQAVSQRGAIQARAGAANVAGVTARALTRLTEASAARYIGALQEEERRDIATTNLQVRDSRMASAQRIQQINQPLGGLPGVAPPVITPQPRSSSFLNVLGGISTGLQLYAGLGGRFPTGQSELA